MAEEKRNPRIRIRHSYLRCPFCESMFHRITQTKKRGAVIVRTHECKSCKKQFQTESDK